MLAEYARHDNEHSAPGLLERPRAAHAALIAEVPGLLTGNSPASRPPVRHLPLEPLSGSELRVLRYLPPTAC